MSFMIAPKTGLGLCPFTATFNRGGRPAAPIHYAVAGSSSLDSCCAMSGYDAEIKCKSSYSPYNVYQPSGCLRLSWVYPAARRSWVHQLSVQYLRR
eukprot:2329624-Rhodomonas_salina.2